MNIHAWLGTFQFQARDLALDRLTKIQVSVTQVPTLVSVYHAIVVGPLKVAVEGDFALVFVAIFADAFDFYGSVRFAEVDHELDDAAQDLTQAILFAVDMLPEFTPLIKVE